MRPRAGITTVHLLLIVVIIIVVAVVLWPVFTPSHGGNTRQARCTSNMKQIGLAMMQYVQDYDEHYPFVDPRVGLAKKDGWESYWSYILQPYIKSASVFHCPTQKKGPLGASAGMSHDYIAACYSGRADSIWLFGCRNGRGVPDSKPATMAQVKSPATVIAVYESGADEIKGQCRGYFTQAWMGDDPAAPMPHSDGGSFCFGDGHVKWYRTAGLVWSGPGPGPGKYYDIEPYKFSVRKDADPRP